MRKADIAVRPKAQAKALTFNMAFSFRRLHCSTSRLETRHLARSSEPTPAGGMVRTMRLWVDADAAPRDVKEIVFRAARRLEVQAVLVANQWISTPMNHPFVPAVRGAGGPDVADRHIAEHAEPGDVAVTADIPLAARLVEKKVMVIDPRGEEYDEENVGERLAV